MRCQIQQRENCWLGSPNWRNSPGEEKRKAEFKVGEKGGVSVYGLGGFR